MWNSLGLYSLRDGANFFAMKIYTQVKEMAINSIIGPMEMDKAAGSIPNASPPLINASEPNDWR